MSAKNQACAIMNGISGIATIVLISKLNTLSQGTYS